MWGRFPLRFVSPQCEVATFAKNGKLALVNGLTIVAHGTFPGHDVRKGVEISTPGKTQLGTGMNSDVKHDNRRVRTAGTGMAVDVARNEAKQRATVGAGEQNNALAAEILVARGRKLVATRKIDPELDSMEKPAGHDEFFRRCFDVEEARACGHPLRITVGDDAASTMRVLVNKRTVNHVGNGFESAVWVPGCASGLASGPVDRTHFVHVDEGV